MQKKLILKQRSDRPHWVGDGFPVRSIFTYTTLGEELSPFLLLDYAGPASFEPTDQIRGVGEHPHRGFETVTIVYSGEVEHRDSSGGGGLIRPGDVQWMTAASGLVHEEMHGKEFAKRGGDFEMVQLWVNLPKKDKAAQPKYQEIKNDAIPKINLPNQAGSIRIIAGDFQGKRGPASTFTAINLWDIRLSANQSAQFQVPADHTTAVFVLSGSVSVSGGDSLGDAEVGVLDPAGDAFSLSASIDSKILFLGGEPIREPIVGYGPFVMNTSDEIQKAYQDYKTGKMGRL